ncbi:MAG: hypothetical protein Q9M20_06735 [Mariprofundaceae bacterium]|nr:hypothetical protein [Mariprofundaceae bacterium]
MPEHHLPSAFVWYHAPSWQEEALKQWVERLNITLNVQAKLYKRTQHEKTTFMEVFECIDSATCLKIEQLAAQQHCFHGIERRCESFERIITS